MYVLYGYEFLIAIICTVLYCMYIVSAWEEKERKKIGGW